MGCSYGHWKVTGKTYYIYIINDFCNFQWTYEQSMSYCNLQINNIKAEIKYLIINRDKVQCDALINTQFIYALIIWNFSR